jgi:hypothetical protein
LHQTMYNNNNQAHDSSESSHGIDDMILIVIQVQYLH